MIREQLKNLKSVKLLGVICGSLVLGLPFIPKLASAQVEVQPQPTRQSNPSRPVGVIQPPMPANQMRAMGRMNTEGNRVDVTLNNDTNARINYQVIGHTNDRIIYEGNGAELLNLPLPVTITAIREDNGLLDIRDMFPDDGQVEFVLQESDFSGSEITIRIEEDGTIFAY